MRRGGINIHRRWSNHSSCTRQYVVNSMATKMDHELAKLFSKEEQAMIYSGNAKMLLNGKETWRIISQSALDLPY